MKKMVSDFRVMLKKWIRKQAKKQHGQRWREWK